jgi:hypothetical protein
MIESPPMETTTGLRSALYHVDQAVHSLRQAELLLDQAKADQTLFRIKVRRVAVNEEKLRLANHITKQERNTDND